MSEIVPPYLVHHKVTVMQLSENICIKNQFRHVQSTYYLYRKESFLNLLIWIFYYIVYDVNPSCDRTSFKYDKE